MQLDCGRCRRQPRGLTSFRCMALPLKADMFHVLMMPYESPVASMALWPQEATDSTLSPTCGVNGAVDADCDCDSGHWRPSAAQCRSGLGRQ